MSITETCMEELLSQVFVKDGTSSVVEYMLNNSHAGARQGYR